MHAYSREGNATEWGMQDACSRMHTRETETKFTTTLVETLWPTWQPTVFATNERDKYRWIVRSSRELDAYYFHFARKIPDILVTFSERTRSGKKKFTFRKKYRDLRYRNDNDDDDDDACGYRYSLLPKLLECRSNSVLRTYNVLYGSGAVARYEVRIKRDHRHPAILSLRVNYALMSRSVSLWAVVVLR